MYGVVIITPKMELLNFIILISQKTLANPAKCLSRLPVDRCLVGAATRTLGKTPSFLLCGTCLGLQCGPAGNEQSRHRLWIRLAVLLAVKAAPRAEAAHLHLLWQHPQSWHCCYAHCHRLLRPPQPLLARNPSRREAFGCEDAIRRTRVSRSRSRGQQATASRGH